MEEPMDVVAPDAALWIRRQVFEHSLSSATLITGASAARIDFGALAGALAAASVTMHPDEPPAVSYQSWVAVAQDHAHLSDPGDADLIIEALETNAPNAFVRCNDVEKLAPGRQLDYRHLLIPVPELVAFLKVHAVAALAARFRETADSVWPSTSVGEVAVDAAANLSISAHLDHTPISPERSLAPPSPLAPGSPQFGHQLMQSPSHGQAVLTRSPRKRAHPQQPASPGAHSPTVNSQFVLGAPAVPAATLPSSLGKSPVSPAAHAGVLCGEMGTSGAVPAGAQQHMGAPASPTLAQGSRMLSAPASAPALDPAPGMLTSSAGSVDTVSPKSAHLTIGSGPGPASAPALPALPVLTVPEVSAGAPGCDILSPSRSPRIGLAASPGGSTPPPLAGLRSPSQHGAESGPLIRKKSTPSAPSSPAAAMRDSSSAMVASVSEPLLRETKLIASNMGELLGCIAATYSILPNGDTQMSVGGGSSGSLTVGASPVRNGKLKSRSSFGSAGHDRTSSAMSPSRLSRSRRSMRTVITGESDGIGQSDDDDDDEDDDDDDENSINKRQLLPPGTVVKSPKQSMSESGNDEALTDVDGMGDSQAGAKSDMGASPGSFLGTPPGSRQFLNSPGMLGSGASDSSAGRAASLHALQISRSHFQHLSFLLTTGATADGTKPRSICSIVPEWRDPSGSESVQLGRLVELTAYALNNVSMTPSAGPLDTAEIHGLDRKTILRSKLPETSVDPTEFPHGREVRITNCKESYIYLLCSLGRVSLIACQDCTLFVGSCVSVSAINCDRVRIHAIARTCRVANSFDTRVFVCTNRRPQIVGDCRGIVFAPYNAIYPFIRRDLDALGIDPARNRWNQFYRPAAALLSERNTSTDGVDAGIPDMLSSIVTTLPPDQFLPFVVPVFVEDSNPVFSKSWSDNYSSSGPEGDSLMFMTKLQIPIPPIYADALGKRRVALEDALSKIRDGSRAGKEDDVSMSDSPMEDGSVMDDGGEMREVEMRVDGVAKNGRSAEAPGKANTASGNCVSDAMKEVAGDDGEVSLDSQFELTVVECFREWLVTSGNVRQLQDLDKLQSGNGSRTDSFGDT